MSDNERKKVWVDEFQTRLFFRIVAYLVLFVVSLGNLLFIWRLLEEGRGNPLAQFGRVLADFAPAFLCLAVLVPVVAWDTVRFSHRLVGPLFRVRQLMRSIADGEPVRPLKLREGDFLGDLSDDFNRMLETLQRQGVSALRPAPPADDPSERRPA
jgi:hypothetical protein